MAKKSIPVLLTILSLSATTTLAQSAGQPPRPPIPVIDRKVQMEAQKEQMRAAIYRFLGVDPSKLESVDELHSVKTAIEKTTDEIFSNSPLRMRLWAGVRQNPNQLDQATQTLIREKFAPALTTSLEQFASVRVPQAMKSVYSLANALQLDSYHLGLFAIEEVGLLRTHVAESPLIVEAGKFLEQMAPKNSNLAMMVLRAGPWPKTSGIPTYEHILQQSVATNPKTAMLFAEKIVSGDLYEAQWAAKILSAQPDISEKVKQTLVIGSRRPRTLEILKDFWPEFLSTDNLPQDLIDFYVDAREDWQRKHSFDPLSESHRISPEQIEETLRTHSSEDERLLNAAIHYVSREVPVKSQAEYKRVLSPYIAGRINLFTATGSAKDLDGLLDVLQPDAGWMTAPIREALSSQEAQKALFKSILGRLDGDRILRPGETAEIEKTLKILNSLPLKYSPENQHMIEKIRRRVKIDPSLEHIHIAEGITPDRQRLKTANQIVSDLRAKHISDAQLRAILTLEPAELEGSSEDFAALNKELDQAVNKKMSEIINASDGIDPILTDRLFHYVEEHPTLKTQPLEWLKSYYSQPRPPSQLNNQLFAAVENALKSEAVSEVEVADAYAHVLRGGYADVKALHEIGGFYNLTTFKDIAVKNRLTALLKENTDRLRLPDVTKMSVTTADPLTEQKHKLQHLMDIYCKGHHPMMPPGGH